MHVNLISSPAGRYISRQPHIVALIKATLRVTNLAENSRCIECDIGRVIGNTNVVATSSKDSVFYARPVKTVVFSRYVKNRSLSPSSMLTILLKHRSDDSYEITDTWIGPYFPPFPGDDNATSASKTYWETHALVADSQPVQSQSITKICPY